MPAYIVFKTLVVSEKDDPPGLERAEDVTALDERGVISQKASNRGTVEEMDVGNYVEYSVSIPYTWMV